ncbi:hypothetical protein [Pantoea sp.]|uniref:hypothetical protein n=1 Tax=Pantoea TaxID=53335 RepID=UPI0028AB8FB5|nr:hypothetical protein [Pantoea sp.]
MLIDGSNIEYYKWILGAFIFILAVIRTGGVSFVFRFALKIIRLKFDDKSIEAENNKLFDLQLYRFISGVNVSNIEDALFMQRNIRQGKFKGVAFLGAGFFGAVGKKINFWDFVGVAIIAFASLAIAFASGWQVANYKPGFANYNFDDGSFMYINTNEVLDEKNNKYIDCNNKSEVKAGGDNYANICDYFLHIGSKEKDKINIKVESAKEARSAFMSISVLSFVIFTVLLLGFMNYFPLNKKFIELKEYEASMSPSIKG